jgi:hypothetical protein
MKKIIVLSTILFLGFSLSIVAQETNKVKQAGHEVKKGATKVGNKTAEIASKGKSRVTDKVYKGKVASGGQTIYINDHSKYYWIDKKGHRHYVTEAQLKDKPIEMKEKDKQ